jgi:hypothetical protein
MIQKNFFASSARQTSFVFKKNSLTPFQVKKYSGIKETGVASIGIGNKISGVYKRGCYEKGQKI